jgi:pyruvate formate lyase activating enzyme
MRVYKKYQESQPNSCVLCHRTYRTISKVIGVCPNCIQNNFDQAWKILQATHSKSRQEFHLPTKPPRQPEGVQCTLCSNECRIAEGEKGYCGLREVHNGKLVHLAGTHTQGLLQWYRDPLPTNCVADWVCEGRHHLGYHNLAVFYGSCTANCLFCQNWHFREITTSPFETISAEQLAKVANSRTFCVCYFGGDPSSQMPHALATSKLLAQKGVRICWETNGMMNPKFLDVAVRYSLETGGCIKFDLKAYDEEIHLALTGVSNQRTLENFARAAARTYERIRPPLVVASTLLVPGYIDAKQVEKIARFIASLNPQIPYALLAFAPNFYMSDLPCTSTQQAEQAEKAAREAGLVNVRIGNRHLLGWEYN